MMSRNPEFTFREAARLGDYRTLLGVPLLREGIPIGVLVLQRAAIRPFTETQIKLVETFADQAVIAVENTRLFEAEQQRTRELTESLDQQTATSEVLQVISRSAFDLRPVLDTLVESAARLCEADFAFIFQRSGDLFHLAASYGFPTNSLNGRNRIQYHSGGNLSRGEPHLSEKWFTSPTSCLTLNILGQGPSSLRATGRCSASRFCERGFRSG